jgi:hypothetical protein
MESAENVPVRGSNCLTREAVRRGRAFLLALVLCFLAPSPHTQPAAASITTHVSPFLGRAAIGAGNVYPWAGQVLRRMLTAGTARLSQVTVRLPANTSTVPSQGTAGGVQIATSIIISVGES